LYVNLDFLPRIGDDASKGWDDDMAVEGGFGARARAGTHHEMGSRIEKLGPEGDGAKCWG
jgi:hypothetical protein